MESQGRQPRNLEIGPPTQEIMHAVAAQELPEGGGPNSEAGCAPCGDEARTPEDPTGQRLADDIHDFAVYTLQEETCNFQTNGQRLAYGTLASLSECPVCPAPPELLPIRGQRRSEERLTGGHERLPGGDPEKMHDLEENAGRPKARENGDHSHEGLASQEDLPMPSSVRAIGVLERAGRCRGEAHSV